MGAESESEQRVAERPERWADYFKDVWPLHLVSWALVGLFLFMAFNGAPTFFIPAFVLAAVAIRDVVRSGWNIHVVGRWYG